MNNRILTIKRAICSTKLHKIFKKDGEKVLKTVNVPKTQNNELKNPAICKARVCLVRVDVKVKRSFSVFTMVAFVGSFNTQATGPARRGC